MAAIQDTLEKVQQLKAFNRKMLSEDSTVPKVNLLFERTADLINGFGDIELESKLTKIKVKAAYGQEIIKYLETNLEILNEVEIIIKGSVQESSPGERVSSLKGVDTISNEEDEVYDFDIALSFAGENRDIVENVAEILKRRDVKVFYDKYEETTLWGKDLYEYLAELYSKRAQYCIIFASDAYNNKVWTTHERKNAQERALKEKREYILPVKLDDTEIPGIPSTIGYLDIRKCSPEHIAEAAMTKLGKSSQQTDSIIVSSETNEKISSSLLKLKEQLSDTDFAIFEITYRQAVAQLPKITHYLLEHIQVDFDSLLNEIGMNENDFEVSLDNLYRHRLFLQTAVDGKTLQHPFVDFISEEEKVHLVCLSKLGFSFYEALHPSYIIDQMVDRVVQGEDPETVLMDSTKKLNDSEIMDEDALNILESWMKSRDPMLNTQVIYFKKVDKELHLPEGTAKKLLEIAAQEVGYTVKRKGKDNILFEENRSTMDGYV